MFLSVMLIMGLSTTWAKSKLANAKFNRVKKVQNIEQCCRTATKTITSSDGVSVSGTGTYCTSVGCAMAQIGAEKRATDNATIKAGGYQM